jgi:hypothetical protein
MCCSSRVRAQCLLLPHFAVTTGPQVVNYPPPSTSLPSFPPRFKTEFLRKYVIVRNIPVANLSLGGSYFDILRNCLLTKILTDITGFKLKYKVVQI